MCLNVKAADTGVQTPRCSPSGEKQNLHGTGTKCLKYEPCSLRQLKIKTISTVDLNFSSDVYGKRYFPRSIYLNSNLSCPIKMPHDRLCL